MKIDKKQLHSIFMGIKQQDKNEFDKLYENYKSLVYGIVFSILKNREDSEEIVQTIFMKIYKLPQDKLPNENEASWLYSFAKNESISFIRRKKEYINIEDIYQIEGSEDELNNIIDKMRYNQIIKKLDETEREIVSLKILSDCSFSEIAKLLDKPVGTIKWKYYKAVNTLKIMLSNLAMFIISFIIGIKTIKDENKKTEEVKNEESNETKKEQQSNENNREYQEDNTASSGKDEQKSSNTEQEIENLVKDSENETKQETIVQEKRENINQYVGISILSISAIFLTLTIVFSIIIIKYQLNRHSKSSK